jgi:succinate-acetate transporter protein
MNLTNNREVALGNTFGATALSSYGGFWIGTAIILTPGGFQIASTLEAESPEPFLNSFGLYLMGWFIFTFLLLICTLRSTVAFFLLFFTLDLAFLMLGLAYLEHGGTGGANIPLLRAGGAFGILAAFLAWYVERLFVHLPHHCANDHPGTTPSPVLPTPATPSSSFLSPTSPGLTRAVRCATRSTTARPVDSPRCKLFPFFSS